MPCEPAGILIMVPTMLARPANPARSAPINVLLGGLRIQLNGGLRESSVPDPRDAVDVVTEPAEHRLALRALGTFAARYQGWRERPTSHALPVAAMQRLRRGLV